MTPASTQDEGGAAVRHRFLSENRAMFSCATYELSMVTRSPLSRSARMAKTVIEMEKAHEEL